ncbi:protein FAM53B [Synchiropus picturatus]
MCVAMVIIYKKTLEKKASDDVASRSTDLGPFQEQTMSQGTTLFSCGLMDSSRRWCVLGHSCGIQQGPVETSLENLWDVLPGMHKTSAHWDWDVGSTSSTISSLLQDLSLTEAAPSTAPPSKRQCRSLSCSDELGSCRTAWRPQGSRLWTTVEKRRCYSGGSVQRGGSQLGFPTMQRSSSFNLPTCSDAMEPPCFSQSASSEPPAQPLYLSHEEIRVPEPHRPSPSSSPDSTPELEHRGGQGLPRSRSQPCVLNDKKIGVKRRRPADTHKQRPSLDLAKMTQKLRNFHSLSCLGITSEESDKSPTTLRTSAQADTEHTLDRDPPRTKETGHAPGTSDPVFEEVDWIQDRGEGTPYEKDNGALWVGLCGTKKDAYQLGGELDIDQIERN